MITTRAVVVPAPAESPVVAEVTLEPLKPDEVLIRPVVTGVCHSDVGWAAGEVYDRFPVVLGHETAGVVAAVGGMVTRLRPGDRVAVSMAHRCGQCEFCESGRAILCARRTERFDRVRWRDAFCFQGFGTAAFAELMVVGESSVVSVPQDVPFEVAAQLGCSTSTGVGSVLNVAEVRPGSTVAVIGAGAVGLNVILGAKLAGAERIVVADPDPERRQAAVQIGASVAIAPDLAELLAQCPGGFNYVFEAAGNLDAMSLAVQALRPGGTATLIGVTKPGSTLQLDAMQLVLGQRRILGSLSGNVAPTTDSERYLRLWAAGRLPIDRLIGEVIPFEQLPAVLVGRVHPNPGKTMVRISDDV